MNKNITVLDMQNHVRGLTYIRRARGLVKKGRARFVDEHTICLACPLQSEDITMDYTGFQTAANEVPEAAAAIKENGTAELFDGKERREDEVPDASWLVRKIDEIVNNTGYLEAALQQLEHLEGEAAVAAGNMIACREQTNQRMIDMLEKLMGKLSI